jgi:CRP-like cAMP-binding protein
LNLNLLHALMMVIRRWPPNGIAGFNHISTTDLYPALIEKQLGVAGLCGSHQTRGPNIENFGIHKGGMMGEHKFKVNKRIRDSLTTEALGTFLDSMEETTFKAGERFITRGEKGDRLYIIQAGTCAVIIEKDGQNYPIVLLKEGDFAGEMALITGEPRTAHVEAETDVVAAQISREKFDAVCDEHPVLREILTNIVQENIFSSIFKEQREVGKYKIQEVLGRHGLSTDYKGVHRFIQMPVVIKVLRHDIAMNPDFYERFRDDAIKIVSLNHENIATVYDVVGLYRTIFIFREFLEGEPLSELLQKTPYLPVNRVILCLQQICAGLAYAHEKRLLHQGLNPNNIIISHQDQVKLVDFGLAFPAGSIDGADVNRVKYMPSEQISGGGLNEQTDIYSLGIIGYEMLTGEKLFSESEGKSVVELTAGQEIPDPRSFRPELPDELCRIILRATRKDPNERYRSVTEILNALNPLVGS